MSETETRPQIRPQIRPLGCDAETVRRLAEIMVETVASGGSIHFMHPTSLEEAGGYWAKALAGAASGERVVLGAFVDDRLEGTVTVFLDTPPNQPFRAEIWKLMVAVPARGRGLGKALMVAAEQEAVARGRTLLNLDTATEGGAASLYEGLGWVYCGAIPDYAYKPQGGLTGTALYYKKVGAWAEAA